MIFTPNIVYGSYAISIEKKNSVHELSMEKRKKKKKKGRFPEREVEKNSGVVCAVLVKVASMS